MTTAPDRLFDEVAYLAYHFHWGHAEILDLEHHTRARFIEEIASINRRIGGQE